MCSETSQLATTVSEFFLCSSAYSELCKKLWEHLVQVSVLWTALINGNIKGGCWQEGSWWKWESALSHPRSWVTVEIPLENLKPNNGLFLSASNYVEQPSQGRTQNRLNVFACVWACTHVRSSIYSLCGAGLDVQRCFFLGFLIENRERKGWRNPFSALYLPSDWKSQIYPGR